MSTDRIEKRVELNAPIARVWRALTDHREFGEWFRVKLETPFVVGRTSHGQVTYPGYEHVKMELVVEKMEAERLFAFRWHPAAIEAGVDYSKEPTTLVEFRLQAAGEATQLELVESGFDRLPAARRDHALRMNEGGWTHQMQNIKRHVE